MAVITTALRDELVKHHDPAELLNALNERLLDRLLQNQMNSALICAVFNPRTYDMTIANAGMVQPYARLAGGAWDFVDIGGYPLGASQRANYRPRVLHFKPGDLMALFSDGVVESMNRRGEFFGFERFEALLAELPDDASPTDIVERILRAIQEHLGDEIPQDDITVMVVRALQTEPQPSLESVLSPVPSVVPVEPTNGRETLLRSGDGASIVAQATAEQRWLASSREGYEMPRQNVELFLPSMLGYEKVARNAAEAIAREMGFSEDRINDLMTAVAEACMNAIEHGNQLDRSTSVTVLLSAAPGHLQIRVEDRGRQRIPDPLPAPGAGEPDRGWGMFFIQNLMDEVEITRLPEGGNQVKMTIYLGKDEGLGAKSEPTSDASEWVDEAD
jgi:serine/threonine-protein kinase RsbW